MPEWEPAYGFCGTRETSNEDLAAALEVVRRRICLYAGDRCDCKYGMHPDTVERDKYSERSGCPELREVINRLLHRPGTFSPEAEITW